MTLDQLFENYIILHFIKQHELIIEEAKASFKKVNKIEISLTNGEDIKFLENLLALLL